MRHHPVRRTVQWTWWPLLCGSLFLGSCCWNFIQPVNRSEGSLTRTRNKKTQISRQMHSQTENYVSEKSYLVTESSAMTKTDLRRRLALRKPLPERLALMFPLDEEGGQPQDARLKQFDMSGQFVEVSLNGKGTLKLVEKHASLWRVQSSDSDVAPGTLVQMYDATPDAKAPDSAQTSGAVKSSILHKSSATGGGMAWNGMAGFSLEGCPRDFDGVHVAFTVWNCHGGSCSMLQEGEDAKALVCEFGALKRGLSDMIPGESRRFWIPGDVKDRRFGRPPPESSLPFGDLVVDLTLLGIEREAVFDYKLSEEAIKLGEERERNPVVVAQRALGIGIQLWTWSLVYSYYQGAEDLGTIGFSHSVHL